VVPLEFRARIAAVFWVISSGTVFLPLYFCSYPQEEFDLPHIVLLVTCANGTFVPSTVLIHNCDGSNAAPEWVFHGMTLKQRTFAGMDVAQLSSPSPARTRREV
jgi:hypothetical protein